MMTTVSDQIRPGDRVLCALSGGIDSVYLLDQMRLLLPARGAAVLAAHFNHHLRGAESDRDEAFVRDLCARWGIPLLVGHAAGLSGSEAEARAARYAFLEETAEREHCAWILTAHTADDQLETMLLHLARGAGLRGLAGIPPRRGKILRPLLNISREEIVQTMTERAIPFVEDSTNAADVYARNRIRHEAVPALRSVNPGAVCRAAETAASLREDEAFLQTLAEDVLAAQSGPGVSLSALRALSRPVRARVFRRLFGPGLEQVHVEALHAFCGEDAPASLDLPGVRVRRERGRLYPEPEPAAPLPELELTPGLDRTFPEQGWRVRVSGPTQFPEIYDSLTVSYFKITEIRGKLMLTSRKPGDALRLPGRGCTKRLGALLAEAAVPVAERDALPVIRDAAGVALVPGVGQAERLMPRTGDTVLAVTLENWKNKKKEEKKT